MVVIVGLINDQTIHTQVTLSSGMRLTIGCCCTPVTQLAFLLLI